jgi:hypothetical protein
MRTLFLCVLCVSSTALAQAWGGYVSGMGQNGAWGGYVSGWSPQRHALQLRTWGRWAPHLWPWFTTAVSVGPQPGEGEGSDAARRDEALRLAAEALAARRESEERAHLQTEREYALALADQQRRVAALEREHAEQQRRDLEAAQAEAAQLRAALQQQLLAEREREIAAREAERLARARDDKRRGVKSPQVFRWVDEDGVIHLSTKPRSPVNAP